jgi:hypothetical protein
MQVEIMKDENMIKQTPESIKETQHDISLIIFWATSLGMLVMFTCFTIFALHYPESFKNTSEGIGFFGIALALFTMVCYFSDKLRDQQKSNKIERRLKHIEEMAEKWDFEYNIP